MVNFQGVIICNVIVTCLLKSARYYKQQSNNALTATYKKSTKGIKDIINKENIKYAKQAGIFDKIVIIGIRNCFMTLKNHRENFVKYPKMRIINPAKNQFVRISKLILHEINTCWCKKLKRIEWKNITDVIN